MDSVTVTDGCTEGSNETDIHGYTTVSFVEGEGSPNLWVAYHPSALSSALLSWIDAGRLSEQWHIAISPNPLKMCVVSRIYVWAGVSVWINFNHRTEWTTDSDYATVFNKDKKE